MIGIGDLTKSRLSELGIEVTPECKCAKRCRMMNERGYAWCRANVDEIVCWFRDEMYNRGEFRKESITFRGLEYIEGMVRMFLMSVFLEYESGIKSGNTDVIDYIPIPAPEDFSVPDAADESETPIANATFEGERDDSPGQYATGQSDPEQSESVMDSPTSV